jgi:hypothetical protein
MDLSAAIVAVEAAQTTLSNSANAQTQAQTKFDAAVATKTTADADEATSVTGFNASLDLLITAATAAKIAAPAGA